MPGRGALGLQRGGQLPRAWRHSLHGGATHDLAVADDGRNAMIFNHFEPFLSIFIISFNDFESFKI